MELDEDESTACPADSVVLPEVLHVSLSEPLIWAVSFLPLGETTSKDADFLRNRCLLVRLLTRDTSALLGSVVAVAGALLANAPRSSDRLRSILRLSLSDVLQCSAGASLFGQGTVEDDGPGVLELAQECGQPLVELVGGNPAGALDVASNMIFGGRDRQLGIYI